MYKRESKPKRLQFSNLSRSGGNLRAYHTLAWVPKTYIYNLKLNNKSVMELPIFVLLATARWLQVARKRFSKPSRSQ